ncbi:putative nonsense-mediated mRNA decay protein [Helianthus annuus]|nr:putative nonsense-mediated mRNA decay protein [Helianthus annuus]
MKGPLDRTKVVLRHLPHTISESVIMEQIDARFAGRYNWFCFRSGKNSYVYFISLYGWILL